MEVAILIVLAMGIVWVIWAFAYEQGKEDGWMEGFDNGISITLDILDGPVGKKDG